MNIFDQLYEIPDVDDPLEPCFDIDPQAYLEYDLVSNCIDQGEM
jgi:hypothetical protein